MKIKLVLLVGGLLGLQGCYPSKDIRQEGVNFCKERGGVYSWREYIDYSGRVTCADGSSSDIRGS